MKTRNFRDIGIYCLALFGLAAVNASAQHFEAVQMKPILVNEIGGLLQDHADFRSDDRFYGSKLNDLRSFTVPINESPRAAARAEAAKILNEYLIHPEEIERQKDSLDADLGKETRQLMQRRSQELKKKMPASDWDKLRDSTLDPNVNINVAAGKLQSLFDGWAERWSEPTEVTVLYKYQPGIRQRYTLWRRDGHVQHSKEYLVSRHTHPWLKSGKQLLLDPLKAEANDLDDKISRMEYRLGLHTHDPLHSGDKWIFGLLFAGALSVGGTAMGSFLITVLPAGYFIYAAARGYTISSDAEEIDRLGVADYDHIFIERRETLSQLDAKASSLQFPGKILLNTGAIVALGSAAAAFIGGTQAFVPAVAGFLAGGLLHGIGSGLAALRAFAAAKKKMVSLEGIQTRGGGI